MVRIIYIVLMVIAVICACFVALISNSIKNSDRYVEQLCKIDTIADGFSWAENLIIDNNGSIYASDDVTGIIYKLTYIIEQDKYEKEVIMDDGYVKCLGLALSEDENYLYAVVQTKNGTNQILEISTQTQFADVLVDLPSMFFFNGLAMHYKTKKLYTTNEGYFLPKKGIVYEIDVEKRTASPFIEGLISADGAWIDQNNNILYVSELFTLKGARIVSIDLNKRTVKGKSKTPAISMLDDFCLEDNNMAITGADFLGKRVVRFSLKKGQLPVILAKGLNYPTSVRKIPKIFAQTTKQSEEIYFVTESGLLASSFGSNKQRVLRLRC